MKFDRKLIKRFASFLKGSRKMFMVSIITAILSSGIGILLPFLVGRAIDSINEDGVDFVGLSVLAYSHNARAHRDLGTLPALHEQDE